MPVSGNKLNILYAWYENIIQKQVCPTCRGSFIGRAFGFETILRNMNDSRLDRIACTMSENEAKLNKQNSCQDRNDE